MYSLSFVLHVFLSSFGHAERLANRCSSSLGHGGEYLYSQFHEKSSDNIYIYIFIYIYIYIYIISYTMCNIINKGTGPINRLLFVLPCSVLCALMSSLVWLMPTLCVLPLSIWPFCARLFVFAEHHSTLIMCSKAVSYVSQALSQRVTSTQMLDSFSLSVSLLNRSGLRCTNHIYINIVIRATTL